MFRVNRYPLLAVSLISAKTLSPVSEPVDILKHVSVSDAAWQRLAFLNKRDKLPNRYLRLKIVPGGCRGFTYHFVLANTKNDQETNGAATATTTATTSINDDDETFEDDVQFVNDSCVAMQDPEADTSSSSSSSTNTTNTTNDDDKTTTTTVEKFVIDGVSLGKLKEAKVEFISNLSGSGFIVDGNKNVDKSCACKMSFSMRGEDE